jgi:hypothetical protein
MRIARYLLAIVVATSVVQAQPTAAAQAREAYRRAVAAERGGLADSAWRELQRAAQLWPVQPAYLEAVAVFAAQRRDHAAVEQALLALSRLPAGLRALDDSAVMRAAESVPRVAAAREQLRRALADVPRSLPALTLDDSLLYLEGITVGARTGAVYLTSLRQRAVLVRSRDGGLARIAFGADIGAVLGIAVAPDERTAWITTAALPTLVPDTPAATRAELIELALPIGTVRRRWILGDGSGTPGEITRTRRGDILVSDGVHGALYRLPAGSGELHTIRHRLLRSPQGIAESADGRFAWVADWSTGLLRWRFSDDTIDRMTEPAGATLVGIDGLVRAGNTLIGIQNGLSPARVVGISLNTQGDGITNIVTLDRQPYEGDPTVGAVRGDCYLFVASAPWPFFDDNGTRRRTTPLPGGVVRALALGKFPVERCGALPQ